MKLHNYYSFINENKQLAEKVYVKTGELSQENFEKILKITGGDNFTKIVCELFVSLLPARKTRKSSFEEGQDEQTKHNLKVTKEFYDLLVEYTKNKEIFPIQGFDYLSAKKTVGDVSQEISSYKCIDLILDTLRWRRDIIKEIKSLPPQLTRNWKSDIRKPRPIAPQDGNLENLPFEKLRDDLYRFMSKYKKKVLTKPKEIQEIINNKIFKSGSNLESAIEFLKKGILGIELPKQKILDLQSKGDIEIAYDKRNIIVAYVETFNGIVELGRSSMWCYSQNNDDGKHWWNELNPVWVIIDYNKPPDSPNYMYTLYYHHYPSPLLRRCRHEGFDRSPAHLQQLRDEDEEGLHCYNLLNQEIFHGPRQDAFSTKKGIEYDYEKGCWRKKDIENILKLLQRPDTVAVP